MKRELEAWIIDLVWDTGKIRDKWILEQRRIFFWSAKKDVYIMNGGRRKGMLMLMSFWLGSSRVSSGEKREEDFEQVYGGCYL